MAVEAPTEHDLALEAAFEMPKPGIGDPVTFYPKGNTASANKTIGFVTEVGNKCIRVTSLGHVGYEGVRHVDDPAAKRSREIRESGLWDYPASHKKLLLEIDEVRQSVEKLQQQVAEMQSTTKKSTAK